MSPQRAALIGAALCLLAQLGLGWAAYVAYHVVLQLRGLHVTLVGGVTNFICHLPNFVSIGRTVLHTVA